MKLTDAEIDYIASSPDGLSVAMDYHDLQICKVDAMGFDISYHKQRYAELKAEWDKIKHR